MSRRVPVAGGCSDLCLGMTGQNEAGAVPLTIQPVHESNIGEMERSASSCSLDKLKDLRAMLKRCRMFLAQFVQAYGRLLAGHDCACSIPRFSKMAGTLKSTGVPADAHMLRNHRCPKGRPPNCRPVVGTHASPGTMAVCFDSVVK